MLCSFTLFVSLFFHWPLKPHWGSGQSRYFFFFYYNCQNDFSSSDENTVVRNDIVLLFVFLSLVHRQLLTSVIFCRLLILKGKVKVELKKIRTHGGGMSTIGP